VDTTLAKAATTIKDLSQAHGNQFGKAGLTYPKVGEKVNPPGRWPANLIHDGSDEVVALFPTNRPAGHVPARGKGNPFGGENNKERDGGGYSMGDSGSAARFFYCAKASRSERNAGCEELETIISKRTQAGGDDTRGRPIPQNHNHHATVKPVALMRYLCRLVTPPGGIVLDPFLGSGTTAIACVQEGFRCIGIERKSDYCEIAAKRIDAAMQQCTLDLT